MQLPSMQMQGVRGRLMLTLRGAIFLAGEAAATTVFALTSLLVAAAPYRTRYAIISRWTHVVLWWLRVTCAVDSRTEGEENIPNTPCIILSKHQSSWETIRLPGLFVPQVWVIKRELLRVPLFGWGLALLKPIAIDRKARKTSMQQVVEQGCTRLEEGCWVVVFPEGTRTRAGHKGRYHRGGAVLAEHSGYPVVPVAHNAGDYWPRNSFFKYPGTIELRIGPPIESAGRSAAEILELAESWIETTVAQLRSPYAPSSHAPSPASPELTPRPTWAGHENPAGSGIPVPVAPPSQSRQVPAPVAPETSFPETSSEVSPNRASRTSHNASSVTPPGASPKDETELESP